MRTWDYKEITDMKIRKIYARILTKRTGKKHNTSVHATLKRSIQSQVLADLMVQLHLSEEQAKWLYNSHTVQAYQFKEELMRMDPTITDPIIYDYYGFGYRTRQQVWPWIWFFVFFLVVALVMMVVISIQNGPYVVEYLTIQLSIIIFIGFLLFTIYEYYHFAFILNEDLREHRTENIAGSVIKCRVLKHIQGRRRLYFNETLFALKMWVQSEDGKVHVVFYPFLLDDIQYSQKSFGDFRKFHRAFVNQILKVKPLDASVYTKSKLISSPIPRIDNIIRRRY